MSSTHMDFSPQIIDRKQDITSWPEGDVTRLTNKDQKRYQKRKAAIIEYFQSEAPVEEISLRHYLPATDSLETLAQRCLMLHEDGQPWGLRALVPGVRVVDQSASTKLEASSSTEEDEDTGEHEAIKSTEAIELPQTPLPASVESTKEDAQQIDLLALESEADAVSEQPHDHEHQASATEEIQAPLKEVESEEELAEVEQEDFPASEENTSETLEEVEQEDFPAAEENAVEGVEEVEQEDFPAAEKEASKESEEIEQEDFPVVEENAVEVLEEAEQKDFPVEEDGAEEAEELTTKLGEVEGVEDESETPEEVEQEEFPVVASEVVETESVEQEDKPELTEIAVEEERQTQELIAEASETVEEDQTQKLTDETSEAIAEEVTEPEAVDERAEVDELDTVEVAKVEAEGRREHVASVETIKVPAAALKALEEADRVADLAATETVETSVVSAEKQVANLSEDDVKVVAEQAEDTVPVLGEQRRNSQQLSLAQPLRTPSQSLAEESRYRVTGSQAAIKHAVRRRWDKQNKQKKYRRWVRIVSAAVIVSILVVLAIPLCVGLMGYNTYTNIKGVASDGINNLMTIKDLIPANKNDLFSVLNTQKLTQAQTSLSKAQDDFLQLQDMVNRPDIQSLLQQWAPEYSGKLDMARHLVQVALDASRMGQELVGVAQLGANVVHGGALLSSGATKPLLTADDISAVQAALVHAQYYIGDIQTQMSQVNLASMPFGSAAQKAQITKYLKLIPQAQGTISQVQGLVGPVSWLLGVGTPRNFLVQTLDRGELRPSGGFEGQYGVLTLNNGRMSPFSLTDITKLDYAENGNEFGNHPPAQYKWMDFGYFGVRDANLSADYPTTAKMVMQLFQAEGGGPVDGDIQITPVLIEQFLDLTGPLYLAPYKDTVTAQNLEQKLHAYQQDPKLIALQKQITDTNTHSTRKAFTGLVGSMLLDRAKHLTTTQLIDFGKIMLKDLKSRDLQIYFTNPVAEQWLQQNNESGAMPQFTNGTDGFMVVQANISISKAAQYVQSTFNDQVKLDANGGATHNLSIKLNYNQTGPVYGYNSYADYLRVYAPANAQFISGYGFDTGQTLCTSTGKAPPPPPGSSTGPGGGNGTGGGTGSGNGNGTGSGNGTSTDTTGSYSDLAPIYGCGKYYHVSPNTDYRSCPDGNYELGYNGMMAKPWPIQDLGGPSQRGSDLPGYNMWGGMTLTPKNCTSTITLSWYVPGVVQHTLGQSPYQMIVGHQAGWPDNAQVNVDASALKGIANLSYNNTINDDTTVALPALPKPPAPKQPTPPTPAATPTGTGKKH